MKPTDLAALAWSAYNDATWFGSDYVSARTDPTYTVPLPPDPRNRATRRARKPRRGVGWTRKGTLGSQCRAYMRGEWGGPW